MAHLVALLGLLRHWVTRGSGKQAATDPLWSFIASLELIRRLAAIKCGFVVESHLPNDVFSIGHHFPLGIFLPVCKGWRCWGCCDIPAQWAGCKADASEQLVSVMILVKLNASRGTDVDLCKGTV